MKDKDEIALALMSADINRRQDELINLEATFKRLGGSFDGDQDEPPAKLKLLTGPKQKKPRKKKSKRKAAPPPVGLGGTASFTINGKSIRMKQFQHGLVELMLAGSGRVFSNADIAETIGRPVANPTSFFKQINKRLAPAQVHVINVPRQGWKLEKLA